MYGLADRITRSDTAAGTGEEGLLVPLFPHAGVMVLEQQGSSILELVRACVGTSCATVSAADAATALAQLPTAQPGVVVIDQSLDPAEAELLAGGLADAGLDAIPLITIDPSQPISASDLRARVLAALHVSRRVWFGGGLRSRMVA